MRKIIEVDFDRDEYPLFATILSNEEEFPCSYEGWLEHNKTVRFKRKDNESVKTKTITVHFGPFVSYCKATNQEPSLVMIEAFAVSLDHKSSL